MSTNAFWLYTWKTAVAVNFHQLEPPKTSSCLSNYGALQHYVFQVYSIHGNDLWEKTRRWPSCQACLCCLCVAPQRFATGPRVGQGICASRVWKPKSIINNKNGISLQRCHLFKWGSSQSSKIGVAIILIVGLTSRVFCFSGLEFLFDRSSFVFSSESLCHLWTSNLIHQNSWPSTTPSTISWELRLPQHY